MNLRYMALRLLIRLSDFLEIGIIALRPDLLPSPATKPEPDHEHLTPAKNDDYSWIHYERKAVEEFLRDCLELDQEQEGPLAGS